MQACAAINRDLTVLLLEVNPAVHLRQDRHQRMEEAAGVTPREESTGTAPAP